MKKQIQIGVGDANMTAKGFIDALRTLRTGGPMSVRALANKLKCDYKNVHIDVRRLEQVGLIGRTKDDKIEVPWDIVEARLRLAA